MPRGSSHGVLLLLAVALVCQCVAAAAAGNFCGNLPPTLNSTACDPSKATCCSFHWSPNGQGCCPMPDATCCSNGYTCCPSGYTCKDSGSSWDTVTTCVPPAQQEHGHDATLAESLAASVPGKQICKIGPGEPFSKTLKNCIIFGDSVSIGYTPAIEAGLADLCMVQHAPYPNDGGVCETAYGEQCLDYFWSSPSGELLEPDLMYFNWGLHNLGGAVPGQSGEPADYLGPLTNITARLKARSAQVGAKLIFGITSPMLCNEQQDTIVLQLNAQARTLMQQQGIQTVDLHQPIIDKCGPVPQSTCFNHEGCFCPHCTPEAYGWLANSTIVPVLRKMLQE